MAMVDAKHNSSAQIAMVVFMFVILFVVCMCCQFVAGSARMSIPYRSYGRDRLVVDSGHGVVHLLLVLRRQLRRTEVEGQLVDCSRELEGTIVGEVHRRSGVEPDVEALIGGHEKRNGVLDRLAGDLLAIHAQHAGAALGEAGSVVLEVKYYGVLAFTQR